MNPKSNQQPQQVKQAPSVPQPGTIQPTNTPNKPPATPQKNAEVKINRTSTQNMLQIAEIRDGIVIMSDGSFRSVVMAKSINFDLMSAQEQESVEAGYQAFLNSLYFDIQIFIRSQKVDIRPYLDKLAKTRSQEDNMLLGILMDDYIDFITDLSTESNIMDKYFYIVVPFFSNVSVKKAITQSKNFFSGLSGMLKSKQPQVTVTEQVLGEAKDELRNRIQAVIGGLQQCGVQAVPLDTQELIELYYDFYNPDTATRQQLHNFDDVSAPVIVKGQGHAPKPSIDGGI